MAIESNWRAEAQHKLDTMPERIKDLRQDCIDDLRVFARTFNNNYVYGDIHMDIYKEMMDYKLFDAADSDDELEIGTNKLVLLPRAHLKSHMVATWVCWVIVRHPEVTIMYVSATSKLAETQLYAIKNIMGSSKFRKLFPEYINPDKDKRERWNNTEVIIDHQKRIDEGIRDATIITAGLTTNTTGWHADIIACDDIVVPTNAYTEGGRDEVMKMTSQFTSIRNAGGFTMAAGTRYHPSDIYDTWAFQMAEVFDTKTDELIDKVPVWKILEHKVEVDGDFLWPRQVRDDGKAFGFNRNVLARIYAEYEDKVQFHAQYYNDPNEKGSNRISRSKFQYYDKKHLIYQDGRWYVNRKPLNIYASIDFAYSRKKKSDWTSIVVMGIDPDGYIYVLDIDRFKTDKTSEYFKHILDLHSTYYFRKMRAETTAAQKVIVQDIKDMVRKEGMSLSIDEHHPTRHEGSKEERVAAVLEPRYDNMTIYHYKGGYCLALEEEVILARPKHDDIKDAFASAIEIAIPPRGKRSLDDLGSKVVYNNRFGGVRFSSRGAR